MNTNLRPYFHYSKSQRTGIISLLAIILAMQFLHFVHLQSPIDDSPEKQNWLALQTKLDSMNAESKKKVRTIYPFNPNFITDYKGYVLGMSLEEIDRLHEFRKSNRYVNSAAEFQQLTKVSDSLLATMSPYFKFPDWVNSKNDYSKKNNFKPFAKPKIVVLDINNATVEDLDKVYGIGEALAGRILKLRNSLGGFVSMEQMSEVYGLSPEVIENLNKHFVVGESSDIPKIKINQLSIKELALFPYFRYALAKQIVTYRSMNGDIKSVEELTKIKGFPIDKAHIIALYLDF